MLDIATTAETYILLSLRDKKQKKSSAAAWASIAIYIPLYLDREGVLAEQIVDHEAREMYYKFLGKRK
jgi:hypothetical protein